MAGKAYLRFAADHPSYLRVMFGRGFPEGFVPPESLRREEHRAFMPVYRAAAALAATESDPAPAKEFAFAAWSPMTTCPTVKPSRRPENASSAAQFPASPGQRRSD